MIRPFIALLALLAAAPAHTHQVTATVYDEWYAGRPAYCLTNMP